jgi:hypothetical protein
MSETVTAASQSIFGLNASDGSLNPAAHGWSARTLFQLRGLSMLGIAGSFEVPVRNSAKHDLQAQGALDRALSSMAASA